MKESEARESAVEKATENEASEAMPMQGGMSGHAPAVKAAINAHKAGHVPFPTLGSSGGSGHR